MLSDKKSIKTQEYDEFSKVSLHTHLGGCDQTIDKKYGFRKNKFDYQDVVVKLVSARNNNFDLLGMTNSNVILPLEFILSKKLASVMYIELICGAEICIKNENKDMYLHTVVLFPDNIDIVKLTLLFEENFKNNNGYYLTIKQLVNILFTLQRKAIVIPHGIKQSSSERSSSKNPEQFIELIGLDNSYPVLIEDNKEFHKTMLENELGEFLNTQDSNWLLKNASVASVDRNKEINFSNIGENATFIWGNNSFNDLYFAALMKKSRIKKQKDIIKKDKYISKIVIESLSDSACIQSDTIYCSHGLNTIIGKSGSGKTLLLNEINYILKGRNLDNKISNSNNTDGYRNICEAVDIKLYGSNNKVLNKDNELNVFEGENLYNKMLEIFTSDKSEILSKFNVSPDFSSFNNLLIDYENRINNYVKLALGGEKNKEEISSLLNRIDGNVVFLKNNVSNASTINECAIISLEQRAKNIEEEVNKINKDIEQIDKIKIWLKSIETKYKFDVSYTEIISNSLALVKKHIEQILLGKSINHKELQIERTKKMKLNLLINDYNKKLGDKAAKVVARKKDNVASVTALIKELESLYLNEKLLQVPLLTEKDIENSFSFDRSDESIRVEFEKINLEFLEPEKLFSKNNIGRTKGAVSRTLFNNILGIKLDDENSMREVMNIFVKNNHKELIQISKDNKDYISFKVKLVDENGNFKSIDEMTAGQLGKIYIANLIKNGIDKVGGNLIILFDQPENNLEKEYVFNDLIAKLDELKAEYQVFITTHEPLLVVNGDANNIILATNEKAINQDNNIKYENMSFVDKNLSKKDMVNEIARLVDGSRDAVKSRNRIYGGMKHGN